MSRAEPRNARSRRTTEAILSTTLALVEEQGFGAVTMAAVAERAGVSRRAIYLHYASRTELLVGVFDYSAERYDLEGSLRPVWEAPDAAAALGEWAAHLSRFHVSVLAVGQAIERARATDEVAARLWQAMTGNWRKTNLRLARWLEREGRLAPPWTLTTATDLLGALMSYEFTDSLVVRQRWSRKKYAEHMSALVETTLVRPAVR